MTGVWRPRFQKRETRKRDDGKPVMSLGIRIGYWPCLRAPFIQVDLFTRILEVWIGHKSYTQPVLLGRAMHSAKTGETVMVDLHG